MSETNLTPSFYDKKKEKERIAAIRKMSKNGYGTIGKFLTIFLWSCLALGIFVIIYSLINLNTDKAENMIQEKVAAIEEPNFGDELKKRLGSTTFSVESYDDWAKRFGLKLDNKGLDADPDKDDLPNYLEYVHGTNPLNLDTDGDKFTDKQEITNGYDPDALGDSKPGVVIQIDKIGVAAPMVWSQSDSEQLMLKDLESGLSHYYKTASPGQNGNSVISGHSSNYAWAKGNYNHIFENLNNLEKGDKISVITIQKNGRVITYHYMVDDKFTAAPENEKIFTNTTDPALTLSTCWPIRTNLERLIVKATLEK